MSELSDVVPVMIDLDDCGLADGFEDAFGDEEEEKQSLLTRLLKSKITWLSAGGVASLLTFTGLAVTGSLEIIGVPTLNNPFSSGASSAAANEMPMDPATLAAEFPEYAALADNTVVGEGGESYLMEYDPNEDKKPDDPEDEPNEPEFSFAEIDQAGELYEYFIKPLSLPIARGDGFATMEISLAIRTTESSARLMLSKTPTVRAQLTDAVSELDLAKDAPFSVPGKICGMLETRLSRSMPDIKIDDIYVREFSIS